MNGTSKGVIGFLLQIIRMLIISAAISLVLAFIHWLFGVIAGKSNSFLMPFIGGTIGIFGLWFILTVIKTIKTLVQFKKDPMYKTAYRNTGMDYKTYSNFMRNLEDDGMEDIPKEEFYHDPVLDELNNKSR